MPSRQTHSQKDTEDTKKVESVLNQTRCNKGIMSSPSFAQGLQAVQVTVYSVCVCTPASHGHRGRHRISVWNMRNWTRQKTKVDQLTDASDTRQPVIYCYKCGYLSIYHGCKNYAWSTSAFLVRELFCDGCVSERCHFGVLSVLLSCTYFSEGLHLKRACLRLD